MCPKMCFPCQIHLCIEDHMASDFLKCNIRSLVESHLFRGWTVVEFESNHDLFHFFLDCLPPKVCPHFLAVCIDNRSKLDLFKLTVERRSSCSSLYCEKGYNPVLIHNRSKWPSLLWLLHHLLFANIQYQSTLTSVLPDSCTNLSFVQLATFCY